MLIINEDGTTSKPVEQFGNTKVKKTRDLRIKTQSMNTSSPKARQRWKKLRNVVKSINLMRIHTVKSIDDPVS